MKKLLFLSICCLLSMEGFAQTQDTSIYKVNPWVSGGIFTAGFITNAIGIDRILNKSDLSEERVLALNPMDVNAFDRFALRQDVSRQEEYIKLSDWGMYISFASPALLFLDKKIRKDWRDITLLYLETQAVTANIYAWSPLGPTFRERIRPWAYYDEFPLEDRVSGRKRNSFFSGHVSTSAAGMFFTAKVYNDYHPELGAKKWLVYGGALVIPAAVAYYRVASVNHFPSDTIVGLVIGASMGILMPEFHKRQKKWSMSILYERNVKAVGFNFKF